LLSELENKTSLAELQRIYQLLARERAKHIDADMSPEALARYPPTERLFRILTTSGDHLEAELAKVVGENTAESLRDLHHGFGEQHRNSYGCPGGDEHGRAADDR